MNFISLTPENLSTEHICCAIDNKKSASGVMAKKEWLACRMKEGLQFKKLDARGKVFIEYLPAKHAWVPIDADGYLLSTVIGFQAALKITAMARHYLLHVRQMQKAVMALH